VDAVDLRGAFDLLRMQRLTQAAWSLTAQWHVGDLAWQRRFHPGPSDEWPTRLWLDEDDVAAAWGWVVRPDRLNLVVDPSADESLTLEVIDWAITVVGEAAPLCTTVTRGHDEMLVMLEQRGFREIDVPGHYDLACAPADAVAQVAPDGFILRGLRAGDDDLVARAKAHIAAWESKTMTPAVYRTMQRLWPYRHDLDVVAEVVTDGSRSPEFAASCLSWLDEVNGVGELEPVGTDPRFRRRGLAAAVCAEAVRRLGAAGATRAIVSASADPANPGPSLLYRSIGFEEIARTVDLKRN